jgi:hypothetical protein
MPSLITFHESALPEPLFRDLLRRVRGLGEERLRQTYQTTFWFDFSDPTSGPTCVPEQAILALRPKLPPALAEGRGIIGVEWWLSRMRTTDVRVDFHRDRDEKLALAGGPLIHPRVSSVLFLNQVKGGLLAVTAEDPCEDNPSKAPEKLDLELAAPRPNRFVVFRGNLTHGVLDANNQIPDHPLPGNPPLRLALIMNWWHERPTDVPRFSERRLYRGLALEPKAPPKPPKARPKARAPARTQARPKPRAR